jgi:hypothetical protein
LILQASFEINKVTCKVLNQGTRSFFERISYEELVSLSSDGG